MARPFKLKKKIIKTYIHLEGVQNCKKNLTTFAVPEVDMKILGENHFLFCGLEENILPKALRDITSHDLF